MAAAEITQALKLGRPLTADEIMKISPKRKANPRIAELEAQLASSEAQRCAAMDVLLHPDPDIEPDNVRLHHDNCDLRSRIAELERQLLIDKAAFHHVRSELLDRITELEAQNAELTLLMTERDIFIVDNDLWPVFVKSLPTMPCESSTIATLVLYRTALEKIKRAENNVARSALRECAAEALMTAGTDLDYHERHQVQEMMIAAAIAATGPDPTNKRTPPMTDPFMSTRELFGRAIFGELTSDIFLWDEQDESTHERYYIAADRVIAIAASLPDQRIASLEAQNERLREVLDRCRNILANMDLDKRKD
jgi:hypothetical protein